MTPVTLTKAETALLDHAQAVRSRALSIPWPEDSARTIGEALYALTDALDLHSALVNDELHWEAVYPELREYAEPFEVALQKAAEGADETAGWLIEVIGKCCGAEAAALVSGEAE